MNSSVKLAVRPDAVGVMTVDQPGSKANVLTRELWADLDAALDEIAKQPMKGLVIASAKPGIFIAGADLKLLADATGPNDPNVRAFIEQGLRVLEKLESLPFPTCAAIDGAALGGGLEVALACDIRVLGSHPKIQLGLPEVKLGLIPGWGGTQRLPRIVGVERAATMLATGESLSAAEAILAGLAFPANGPLPDAAARWVLKEDVPGLRRFKQEAIPQESRNGFVPLIEPEPVAVREALVAMLRGADRPLADAIRIETEAFLYLAGSPESKRLIGEFFASRKK
ncbi:MAG: enoyl-CoA hydratase-related protein [Gemmataceae bacterium]